VQFADWVQALRFAEQILPFGCTVRLRGLAGERSLSPGAGPTAYVTQLPNAGA
jgi:hypothetical protein